MKEIVGNIEIGENAFRFKSAIFNKTMIHINVSLFQYIIHHSLVLSFIMFGSWGKEKKLTFAIINHHEVIVIITSRDDNGFHIDHHSQYINITWQSTT